MKKAWKLAGIAVGVFLGITVIPLTAYLIKPSLDCKKNMENTNLKPVADAKPGTDRIHFLNTGSSDAILLESGGKFALIDAGEDTDNPRGFEGLELEGYEEAVLAYLKKYAADENGKVSLEFVLGTHSHSDHIGGFDTVIADPGVAVGKAYLKQYDSEKINKKEVDLWDNQEVYDQMVHALQAKNIPIVSKPGAMPFQLGNFKITLFNTDDPETNKKVGENDQSLGVLVEKNGTRVFLAGDIDNYSGDESRLAPQIGKVDLLKVGHHSNLYSSTGKFLRKLSPDTCVITNKFENLNKITLFNITRICDAPILATGKENGVIAVIHNNGAIDYYNQTH